MKREIQDALRNLGAEMSNMNCNLSAIVIALHNRS